MNKFSTEEEEQCRDIGTIVLKNKQHEGAVKMFRNSLNMYPLPGVEVLLSQVEQMVAQRGQQSNFSNFSKTLLAQSSQRSTSNAIAAESSSSNSYSSSGIDDRFYTDEKVEMINNVLRAKKSGRSAHYRILGVSENTSENNLKRAYQKLALKLHPDKNLAPHADEAFKSVGLAYATFSKSQ